MVIGLVFLIGGCAYVAPPLVSWEVTLESGETVDEVAQWYQMVDGCVEFYRHEKVPRWRSYKTATYCGVIKSVRMVPTDDVEAK